ncbi:MAG TPA: SH3 domain-containing protein [Candidatus Limnocylindrales bacterium]|nr:SH3 domain-containing protein [Candidatus Limnocylindrales bacterium]
MIRRLFALSALMMLAAAGPLAAQAIVTGQIDQTANLRAEPEPRAEIVAQLPAGAYVTLIGRDVSGRWLQVVGDEGQTGWLPVFSVVTDAPLSDLPVVVDAIPAPDGEVLIEAYGRVNVRAAPTVTADILGQLNGGELVTALGRDSSANNWLLIALPDAPDEEGWVAWFAVGVRGNPESLPVLTVDAAADVVLPEALVSARFNARLHPYPSISSPILAIVPFGGQVEPIARTADGAWLYVRFGEIVGWGAARLFDLPYSRANALPVFVPLTPTAEPESGN